MKIFKVLFLTIFFLLGIVFARDIPLIEYSKDKCAFCGMSVKNQNIGSIIYTKEGEKLTFCSIECAIGYYLKNEKKVKDIKVPNFLDPSQFIDGKKAFYLKSENLKTPMGMNLSAYLTKEDAEKMQKEKGGYVYSWDELLIVINKEFLPRFMHHHRHMGN